jgi:cytochrome b6-f complex iron-sulfur subunit
MNAHASRRYVDDLLRGRRPTPFRPDDLEAAEVATAIDLRVARLGADAPRPEFLSDLHRRLTAQMRGATTPEAAARTPSTTRRQLMVTTSAAAAAAAAAVTADRLLLPGDHPARDAAPTAAGGDMTPSGGSWQPVAVSSDVTADGVMHPFEHDSLIGFVRRVDGHLEAVSGVCTHQGCQLWFDQPDDRLRCPCHSTSFSPDGQLLAYQLPIAPKPLPQFQVREVDGTIEVFAPAEPTTPS